MSQYEINSIYSAIKECSLFIAREESRCADTRPANIADHLAFCKQHQAKLLQELVQAGEISQSDL